MDQTQDFKSLQDQIQAALIDTTRTTGQISSEDLGFHRSLNAEVGTALDEQSERLLTLAGVLLKSAVSISELHAPVLQDADDVENNWRSVVDVIDSLLEKSDTCLDEYTGVIKRKEPPTGEQLGKSASKPKKHGSLGNEFRTQNLVKPQLAFEHKPNNDDNTPWRPLLTSKPHAIVSLEESLGNPADHSEQHQYDYNHFLPLLSLPPAPATPEGLSKSQRKSHKKHITRLRNMGSTRAKGRSNNTDNYFRYKHPYETEILQLKYPDSIYQKNEPISYLPVESTSAIFVDTEDGVLEMLNELKSATEIAVDLEHHDTRSYVGLVSLMQISTRTKDWIVDTLKPWRQKLQILNEVFADPKIVKVFHGAYMDIGWLQRDLGLYVVGLFDTHWASRTLGYAGGSLAFLLKKFINFDADKKYQMADWRIRPLPEEMFFYARADTHFLLYIYDHMRNELLEKTNPDVPEENRIEIVLQKSKETSLFRYERANYNAESGRGPGGWYSLLVKSPALFNNEQFAVFRAIHEWRDSIARADDDSPAFVMPQHVLTSLAKLMPMDMVALLGIAHPVSHGVKSRAGELLALIKSARSRGKTGPSMIDVLRPQSMGTLAKANLPVVAADTTLKTLVAVFDDTELRSDSSTFWGGAFGSSLWDGPALTHSETLRLAVPLPALSSEIFASSNGLADRSVARELPSKPARSMTPETKEDEAFVIKRGAKRKSDAVSDQEDLERASKRSDKAQTARISVEDIEAARIGREKAAEKAARKAEKRAKKAAKKAAAAGAGAGTGEAEADDSAEVDDEEAFDYSKAESVLHGKRHDGEKGGKKKEKPFDPYRKSEDAPKGMRRLQTERAGKSHTFKD